MAELGDRFSTAPESPWSETPYENAAERTVLRGLSLDGFLSEGKKTLILREIPEDGVGELLYNKDALAACDIAVFVYDSSYEPSWKKTTDLLLKVASWGEATGYQVPSLILAAKDDLDPHMAALQDSTRVSQNMGIDAPIPISMKLGDLNNVFRRIINAAEHPHLSSLKHKL